MLYYRKHRPDISGHHVFTSIGKIVKFLQTEQCNTAQTVVAIETDTCHRWRIKLPGDQYYCNTFMVTSDGQVRALNRYSSADDSSSSSELAQLSV
jgi:hypothetical protein